MTGFDRGTPIFADLVADNMDLADHSAPIRVILTPTLQYFVNAVQQRLSFAGEYYAMPPGTVESYYRHEFRRAMLERRGRAEDTQEFLALPQFTVVGTRPPAPPGVYPPLPPVPVRTSDTYRFTKADADADAFKAKAEGVELAVRMREIDKRVAESKARRAKTESQHVSGAYGAVGSVLWAMDEAQNITAPVKGEKPMLAALREAQRNTAPVKPAKPWTQRIWPQIRKHAADVRRNYRNLREASGSRRPAWIYFASEVIIPIVALACVAAWLPLAIAVIFNR